MTNDLRVAIIGAGLGGLTLAQALHRRGIEVAVYERDRELSTVSGYRLHVDPQACQVLREELPVEVYQALLASSNGRATFDRLSLLDHRLRTLTHIPQDQTGDALLIGRAPLRRLLAHGLDDIITTDATFTGYEHRPGGAVTAHFADERTVEADLLVGADGPNSTLAAQLLGASNTQPTGFVGIAARIPLTDDTRPLVPTPSSTRTPALWRRSTRTATWSGHYTPAPSSSPATR